MRVNGKQPIAFENDFFQGHLLFMVRDSTTSKSPKSTWSHLFNGRRRTLWVQVQGRFKRASPPNSTLFLAAEVPSRLTLGFWTKKLVEVLVSIVKTLSRDVHISFGDGDELPHAAFPLYQSVDELVETPISSDASSPSRVPALGIENFGESKQQQERRLRSLSADSRENPKVYTTDKMYTFQFYTMYADLAQWRIANVPGMPEIPLKKFCEDQPIRFAAYMFTPTDGSTASSRPTAAAVGGGDSASKPHSKALKDYLFCFSVHYTEANRRPATHLVSNGMDTSSVICSPTASSFRSTLKSSPSTTDDLPDERSASSAAEPGTNALSPPRMPRKLLQHEEGLNSLRFGLPMWIEQVDPIAGNRKVSYLFTVDEQVAPETTTTTDQRHHSVHTTAASHRYNVIRSAATIKNALLMLRDDAEYYCEDGELAVPSCSRSHEDEFKKLIVESREFLYETITNETDTVAAALQRIAAIPAPNCSACHLDKLKKAMLHHCLKSSGTLPCIRSHHDIGIQLTTSKRERMDIIWECGVYRVHSPRFLRQEWLILTTNEVHFFRSYTMRACKSVPITDLLCVQSVDAPHLLNPEALNDADPEELLPNGDRRAAASKTQWQCVQLHLLSEIVTLFVDSEDARRHFITSLNQILQLKAKPGRFPAPRSFESQPIPLCLNRRNLLPSIPPSDTLAPTNSNRGGIENTTPRQSDSLAVVQAILQKGLAVYDKHPSERKLTDLLVFLEAVELLNNLELPTQDAILPSSHEEKLAFALNLYHILYIHATLVFASPVSHFQWKKMQSVPYYLIGSAAFPQQQVRVTLEVIEHEMLRVGSSKTARQSTSARKLPLSSHPLSSVTAIGQQAVPPHLAIAHPDFRTNFALQLNCSPGTDVIRVYDGSAKIHEQLNEVCTLFLSQELRVDMQARVVWLPKVCEWHQSDFSPRCSRTAAGLGGSRAFHCLQKLLGFLEDQQRDQVHHVLLGAGKSSRVLYDTFWTQSSRSAGSILRSSSSDSDKGSGSKPSTDAAFRGSGALEFFKSFF